MSAGWRVLLFMLQLLQLLILVRVVLSWVAPVSRHPLVELVRQVTDPILRPIQSVLPSTGPVDLSPMVALFALYILQNVIASAAY